MSEQKPKKNYVENKVIVPIYREWIKACEEAEARGEVAPQIPNKIAEAFMMIADRYSRRPNFVGYKFREDMISEGILACVQKARKFNPDISNNFLSYYTMVIHRSAFIPVIKKEKQILKGKIDYVNRNTDMLVSVQDDEDFDEDSQREILREMFGNNYSMIEFGFLEPKEKEIVDELDVNELDESKANGEELDMFFEEEEAV